MVGITAELPGITRGAIKRGCARSPAGGCRQNRSHPYRRLAFFFFFATLGAAFFPAGLRLADDLVRFAGFFDFLAIFLAVFFGAFAAFAIVFAAFLTGLGSRLATAFLAFFAP